MTGRSLHEVALAAAELADARHGLERIAFDEGQAAALGKVIDQLDDAQARLARQLPDRPGIPVSAAAKYLSVSEPTVRLWIDQGLLLRVADAKPVLVDIDALRAVAAAIGELRARGQDGGWTRALIDYLHDAQTLAGVELRAGLSELERGELEPA